jgi:hypothetical protein
MSKKVTALLGAASIMLPVIIFAADSNVLDSAVSTITQQIKGPGKTLIYSLEGIAGAYTYMQSRNWVNLTGIGLIFIFTSVLFQAI